MTAAPKPARRASAQSTVIEPIGRVAWPDLAELWRYRDTLYFLARRDIAIRYKQTVIGVLWVVLQPIAFALVYTAFLSLIGSVPTQGVPYGVFALAGLTLWLFFVSAMTRVSSSTVASADLISKIWFPRLIIPLSALGPAIVDMMASTVVLLLALVIFGVGLSAKIVLFPFAVGLALGAGFAIGLWFSAIAVRYRDIEQLVPFLVQVLLFTTPILYPADLVPDSLQTLYALNPLVGMVEAFRWVVLPEGTAEPLHVAVTLVFVAIALPTGLVFYERRQHLFADVI
jgi:lipopolysaccharide transport system permease protein